MGIKKAIVLSDLHCGSTYGLLPPGVVSQEENEFQLNPIQEHLWECWQDWQKPGGWLDRKVGEDEFALILNGDLVEGFHHGTKEVVGTYDADHASIALAALKPLVERASSVLVVEGTECHTGTVEHHLAKELGAISPNSKTRHAFGVLRVNIHGCLCLFQHHISTTKRVYLEASQLSIELRNGQQEAMRAGQPIHKLLGAAHRHRFGKYGAGDAVSFVSPPWQAVTRFGRKVVPAAFCEPGVVCLDWTDKPVGSPPDIHDIVYPPPPTTTEIITL